MHREEAAGAQRPEELAGQPGLVRDVHAAVLGPHDVEFTILHREAERVAVAELHAVGEPGALGEEGADPAELLGEVHDGDAAAELRGQGAGGTAEAAADVEHARAALQRRPPRQGQGRVAAADVELVHRREVDRREALGILAGLAQRLEKIRASRPPRP